MNAEYCIRALILSGSL